MNEQITQLAKEYGADGVEYSGKWNNYDVYELMHDEPACVGLPFIILVRGDEIRISTEEEALAYLDTLPDETS